MFSSLRALLLPVLVSSAAFALSASLRGQEPTAGVEVSGPEVVTLWPDGAPGALGDAPKDRPNVRVHALTGGADVQRTAIVVCPGGGYGGLAMGHEGREIAAWLGAAGIVACVLDYRHRGKGYGHPAPLQDVQRAIRLVRSRAADFGIDPEHVGVLGFSAGGHLAASASVHHDAGRADAEDPIERQSSRPDFSVLCYAVLTFGQDYSHKGSERNLLGKNPDEQLRRKMSCERQVDASTPPTFLWHTTADKVVPVNNSLAYYQALLAHDVPCELHVFYRGRHGIGLGRDLPARAWPELCLRWLRDQGHLRD